MVPVALERTRERGTNLVEISPVVGSEIVHGLDPSFKLGDQAIDFRRRCAVIPGEPTNTFHDRVPPGRIQPCRVSRELADLAACNHTTGTIISPNVSRSEQRWMENSNVHETGVAVNKDFGDFGVLVRDGIPRKKSRRDHDVCTNLLVFAGKNLVQLVKRRRIIHRVCRDDAKRSEGSCVVVPRLCGCDRGFVSHVGPEIEEGYLLTGYTPVSSPAIIRKVGLEAQQFANKFWQHRRICDVCLEDVELAWNRGIGAVGDGGDDSIRGSTTPSQSPEQIRVLIIVRN